MQIETRATEAALAAELDRAIDRGLEHLRRTQSSEGSWKGDYGGPLFLLPMYVGTAHVLGISLSPPVKQDMVRYLRRQQRSDGGYGLHVEGESHVFTTVLCYVALRLLGESADDEAQEHARTFLRKHGGPLASASWGKFFLCMLGVYDYRGITPLLPELWLLPPSLPFHPSRLWCHCRMVYLPMAWLYGARAVGPESPVILALRNELYDGGYDQVDWAGAREIVADTDSYVPRTVYARWANRALEAIEPLVPPLLRQQAQAFVLEQIDAEDRNTSYVCIGPVNKLLNTLVWHFHRPGGEEVNAHLRRLPDYLWSDWDGVKMQGYNSSELWDTAFAVQAMVATGAKVKSLPTLSRAADFIDRTQVREDVPHRERVFRHASRGGWPFSTREHGWPISDCTAEGIKASLQLEGLVENAVTGDRLCEAVDLLLTMQNPDGGYATYELTRGPAWLELLNPSDCFADIMIDYSYVECTAAAVEALAAFRRRHPHYRREEIDATVQRATEFILRTQRADGSWEGSWGVCFTYGTMFGVSGLLAAGFAASHPALERAAGFLSAMQADDGGWGESAESCRARRYVPTEHSQAVMTAWALRTLLLLGRRSSPECVRGIRFLLRQQESDGSFPPEHIAGMFNKTSAIHYDNYLKIFPLWALALARP
ncbi:MAG: prenyltransferase/squalene oxidase repeat-containing protein [Myxococcota bacterium]